MKEDGGERKKKSKSDCEMRWMQESAFELKMT